jgi:hypothetical protein
MSGALMGLVCSAFVRSNEQVYFIATMYLLSSVLLTGFLFPLDQSARVVQHLSITLPLTFSAKPLSLWMHTGLPMVGFEREVLMLCGQICAYLALSVLAVRQARSQV